MHLIDRFWISITYVLSYLTSSPFIKGLGGLEQAPVPGSSPFHHQNSPIFKPPGGRLTGPGSEFKCEYPELKGWENCSNSTNRACWLRNTVTGAEYNIYTNYEGIGLNYTPPGIHRTYVLDITDHWINADGLNFTEAKVFNGSYPGPWIQACWGDNVTIIVNNHLEYNGTSIHWHGIRQYHTMHMDGVNGLTQCPIAPGNSFNYTWQVTQYGSSWYHSHYSIQYADGAVGPITLHGPSSASYDEAKLPILMSDWSHNSAFQTEQTFNFKDQDIVLNGAGDITRYNNSIKPQLPVPTRYTIRFDRAKLYLLRLINTSFGTTFIFSIDNHEFQIVGADFVPVNPSEWQNSVLVGIGQRYHIIVRALKEIPPPTDGNFWIRTSIANCFGFNQSQASLGYDQTGILRYDDSDAPPNTTPWNLSYKCSDEQYAKSLTPVVPWIVGNASNGKGGEEFIVKFKNAPTYFPLASFSMGGVDFNPLRIDYGNPTFLNLNNSGPWNPLWVVFPENYTSTDWVYMVIEGSGPHPIHLHGHDFAILQQIENATYPTGLDLKTKNPLRRDVLLIPTNGYMVIAFQTDNPGTWLMHCHIAFHAAEGLALQIMERQQSARTIWPSLESSPALQRAQNGCFAWNNWWGNCTNWWPGNGSSCQYGSDETSPDSGI